LNEYLNTETTRANADPNRVSISYAHTREMDSFYEAPQDFLDSLPQAVQNVRRKYPGHRPRVRVTTDALTKKVKAAIIKIRVGDLEMICPKDAFDIRLSVSLEITYPLNTDTLVESVDRNGDASSRFKDRLSYKHQFVSIDLTQVRPDGQGEKRHELELELDTQVLISEGLKVPANQPNHFEGICGIFTNYVRAVNRACHV
jgi:polynucleotide 5'-triphosphatase